MPRLNLVVFVACVLAVTAWIPIGYYQDEFVYRLFNARFIQDQEVRMGLYSLCESWLTPFPKFLSVQAWGLSFLFLQLSPYEARWLVFLVVALFFLVLTGTSHRIAPLYLTGALVGVAGSSMLYSRPEFLQLFNLLMCLVAFRYSDVVAARSSNVLRMAIVLLLLWSYLISSWSHMQGVMYFPLNVFALYLILRNSKILLTGLLIFMAVTSAVSYRASSQALACERSPQVAIHLKKLSHSLSELPSVLTSRHLYEKMYWYTERFLYKEEYSVDYLPGVKATWWASLLNPLVAVAVLANLMLGFALLAKLAFQLVMMRWRPVAQFELRLFTLMLLAPTVFLFLINAGQHFYRNFYIHLVIVSALVFFYSHLREKLPRAMKVAAIIMAGVFLGSTVANYSYFNPKLRQGHEGWYSIALDKTRNFMHLEMPESCQMDFSKGRLLVDMLSYEHIKHVPFLYSHEYVLVQSRLTGKTPREILAGMDMQGYVFACEKNGALEFCCGKFKDSPTRNNHDQPQ